MTFNRQYLIDDVSFCIMQTVNVTNVYKQCIDIIKYKYECNKTLNEHNQNYYVEHMWGFSHVLLCVWMTYCTESLLTYNIRLFKLSLATSNF